MEEIIHIVISCLRKRALVEVTDLMCFGESDDLDLILKVTTR